MNFDRKLIALMKLQFHITIFLYEWDFCTHHNQLSLQKNILGHLVNQGHKKTDGFNFKFLSFYTIINSWMCKIHSYSTL